MKKVLLITPPKNFEESLIMGFKWGIPHIGLAYISSYVEQFGYETKIIDLVYTSIKSFIRVLIREKPKVIGISATTEEYYSVQRTCKLIKKISPQTIIVLGGPHATPLPVETLNEIPELDICVIGEGEITFKEILDAVYTKENTFKDILGIAYREKNNIFKNAPRLTIQKLDSLPFPDWEKFDLKNYSSFSEGISEHFIELPIITQRGCPYSCVFCQKTRGNKVNARSLENVFKEIRMDYEKYHVNRICIVDETFSLDRNRVIDFCKRMVKEGWNKKITWSCFTRVNLLDEYVVKWMKLSGCRLVSFGVESGNLMILKKIKKYIKLEQVTAAIHLTRKYQIESHYGIIYGHPFETWETMKDSLRFVLKNRPDLITFAILVPFPGTEVDTYTKTNYGGLKKIARSWLDYHKQMGQALELIQLPRKYLDLFQLYSYFRFFIHPYNIRKLFNLVNVKSIPKFFIEKLKSMFLN